MVPPLVTPHHSRPPCEWTLVIGTPPLRLWPPLAPAHCDREKLVGSKGEGGDQGLEREGRRGEKLGEKWEERREGREVREIGGEMGDGGREERREGREVRAALHSLATYFPSKGVSIITMELLEILENTRKCSGSLGITRDCQIAATFCPILIYN